MTGQDPQFDSTPEADETLDRAMLALRDRPVPQGPSAELLAKTRGAIEQEELDHERGRWMLPRPAVLRLAAAVAILIGAYALYRALDHEKKQDLATGQPSPVTPRQNIPPVAPAIPPTHIETPAQSPLVKDVPDKHSAVPDSAVAEVADGEVSGRIYFAGPLPMPVALNGITTHCQQLHGGPVYDESLAVSSDGGLANVVVSVSDGLSGWLPEEFPPRAEPAVLDQKGCVFKPHVVAVMVGEPLTIRNSDPCLHNVHVMAVNNPTANLGQPAIGEATTGPYKVQEVFRVKCDVHPWMEAWVRVVDNPYFAVTGPDGRFSLRGLPPGTYTIKAWHERLGIKEVQVTLEPGKGSAADFTFLPR